MPGYSRDSWHSEFVAQGKLYVPIFGLRNGSERFPSPSFKTGSKDQGYKSKESEKKQKSLLRDLDVAPGGWGPYCRTMSRQDRGMLNTREKVKLDVEFRRMEVS